MFNIFKILIHPFAQGRGGGELRGDSVFQFPFVGSISAVLLSPVYWLGLLSWAVAGNKIKPILF